MQFKIIKIQYCRGYEIPEEDYEIRKSVVSDLGTKEGLLNFLSIYTFVTYSL